MGKGFGFLLGFVILMMSLTFIGSGEVFSQNISRDPTDFAPYGLPLTRNKPTTVNIVFYAYERTGTIDAGPDGLVDTGDDVRYCFYTWGHSDDVTTGKVPGPFIRVLEGDTINFTLHNPGTNVATHSIDLHAVKGYKGGGSVLMAAPGNSANLTFQVLHPGLFVYHCVGDGSIVGIASHISNGMYGLILVEPRKKGRLFKRDQRNADKEYYIVQGDFYLEGFPNCPPYEDVAGSYCLDLCKAFLEEPDYVVFNGRAGVERTTLSPLPSGNVVSPVVLTPNVNDNVIIYFGNTGPNLASSLHMIGDIWDRTYHQGDVLSKPQRNIQTDLVPAAGSAIYAFEPLVTAEEAGGVPGGINVLVDHAVYRVGKGALGIMIVQ